MLPFLLLAVATTSATDREAKAAALQVLNNEWADCLSATADKFATVSPDPDIIVTGAFGNCASIEQGIRRGTVDFMVGLFPPSEGEERTDELMARGRNGMREALTARLLTKRLKAAKPRP